MTDPSERKIGLPVLVVLLLFLAGSAYLVMRVHEDTVSSERLGGRVALDAGRDVDAATGGWVHHDWTRDAGPTAATAARVAHDPQREAMQTSFAADAGVEPPFEPIERELTLFSVRGEPPLGATEEPCRLRVLPVRVGEYDCAVRVTCSGRVLYPNPAQTAGYNHCEREGDAVRRVDDQGATGEDGDPMLSLDLGRGRLTVRDRGEGRGTFTARFRVAR